jgi:hypothetical protein
MCMGDRVVPDHFESLAQLYDDVSTARHGGASTARHGSNLRRRLYIRISATPKLSIIFN